MKIFSVVNRSSVQLFSSLTERTEWLQLSAVSVRGVISLFIVARTFVILRLLGAEEYGLIGLTTAAGGIFSSIQHLGLGVGAAKEAAKAKDLHQLRLTAVLLFIVRILLLLPLLGFLLWLVAPVAAGTYHQPVLLYLIPLYGLYLLVSAPGDIFEYVLTGTERYRAYFAFSVFRELTMTIAMIIMVFLMGVRGYFWGYVIAGLLYNLGLSIAVWNAIDRRVLWPTFAEARVLLKSVFKTSLAVYSSKLLKGFSWQIPVLFAGVYLSTAAVGWLHFAYKIGGYLGGLASAVILITLPRMMRLKERFGADALCRHFPTNFRRVAWGLSSLLLLSLVLSKEITWFVGGAGFGQAWRTAQLMLVFYTCIVLADSIFSGLHFPFNREKNYVLAYGGLFLVSAISAVALLIVFKTPDSVGLAMILGALVLLGLALWQVRDLSAILGSLLHSIGIVLALSLLGLLSRSLTSLGWRMCLVSLGGWMLAFDIWQTDEALRTLIRLGIGRLRISLRSWI